MFQLETLNELYCKVESDGHGAVFAKKGSMVAFRGNCKFDKVMLGPQGNPMQALLGQIGRRLTGENMPLMKCASSGPATFYFADLSQHVTCIKLSQELKVESENLLVFTETCKYSFKFLAQGVISQKGLFTSVLSPQHPDAMVAVTTGGNPLVVPTPCNVDPDALVAWTGPDPTPKLDVSWKNLIGQASGESYNFEFSQPGYQVIIQPTERASGLRLSID